MLLTILGASTLPLAALARRTRGVPHLLLHVRAVRVRAHRERALAEHLATPVIDHSVRLFQRLSLVAP